MHGQNPPAKHGAGYPERRGHVSAAVAELERVHERVLVRRRFFGADPREHPLHPRRRVLRAGGRFGGRRRRRGRVLALLLVLLPLLLGEEDVRAEQLVQVPCAEDGTQPVGVHHALRVVHGHVWAARCDAAVEGLADYPHGRRHFCLLFLLFLLRRLLARAGEPADVAQDVEHELVVRRRAAREDFDHRVDGARLDGVQRLLVEAAHVPPPDVFCFGHRLRDGLRIGCCSCIGRDGARPVGQDAQKGAVDFGVGGERAVGV